MAWFKKKPKTKYELKQALIEKDRSRRVTEHAKTKGYEAETKYAGQQAERRAQAKYAPRKKGGGFMGFATGIGKSMEDIGQLSGTGPRMKGPSAYYQETAKSVRRVSKKGKKGKKGKRVKRRKPQTEYPRPPKVQSYYGGSGPKAYSSYTRKY